MHLPYPIFCPCTLLSAGWTFISNLDNLAACLEPWILGLIESEGIEFLKVKVQGYPGHTYRVKRGTSLRDAVYSSQPELGL